MFGSYIYHKLKSSQRREKNEMPVEQNAIKQQKTFTCFTGFSKCNTANKSFIHYLKETCENEHLVLHPINQTNSTYYTYTAYSQISRILNKFKLFIHMWIPAARKRLNDFSISQYHISLSNGRKTIFIFFPWINHKVQESYITSNKV